MASVLEGIGDNCHGKLLRRMGKYKLVLTPVWYATRIFQVGMIQSYIMNDGKQDVLTVVS